MENEKNLKGKKLNKVSGGLYPLSPIIIAAEHHGLKSPQCKSACKKAGWSSSEISNLDWDMIDNAGLRTDRINQSTALGQVSKYDINFLRKWGSI